jgi:hypothetical protein
VENENPGVATQSLEDLEKAALRICMLSINIEVVLAMESKAATSSGMAHVLDSKLLGPDSHTGQAGTRQRK